MSTEITYLASPYTPHNGESVEERFKQVCVAAASLMSKGHTVFCPIAHSHPIAEFLPKRMRFDHMFWMYQDLPLLKRCNKVVVLMLPGWEKSRGVRAELEYATELNIPIEYMEPEYMNEAA